MRGRFAGTTVMLLTLGACAGVQDPVPPPSPQADMTGRWMLSAPNAPACGMDFSAGRRQGEGAVVPDGGCPGQFYMSRRWVLTQDTHMLTISDDAPLAQLVLSGGQFTGQSTTGVPVTLAR
jgi:hypothetical protein